MSKEQGDVLARIDAIARKRGRLLERAAALDVELRSAVMDGIRVGVPKLTLARRAQMSRQTIYTMLSKMGR